MSSLIIARLWVVQIDISNICSPRPTIEGHSNENQINKLVCFILGCCIWGWVNFVANKFWDCITTSSSLFKNSPWMKNEIIWQIEEHMLRKNKKFDECFSYKSRFNVGKSQKIFVLSSQTWTVWWQPHLQRSLHTKTPWRNNNLIFFFVSIDFERNFNE